MMKTLIAIALYAASIVGASAQVHVNGYSSEVLATARFNAAMNTFPRSKTVVANLFTQLDQQNQPLVAATN